MDYHKVIRKAPDYMKSSLSFFANEFGLVSVRPLCRGIDDMNDD